MPAAAERVAAVPYDVVSTSEARALALGNPLSFLHVSRAEIDLPSGTDPHADAVYERAARNFAELRERAPLVVEDAPSLYVYRLRMGAHVQTGVAGCFSLHEYDHDVIKKHEHTRPDKEDDRTRHLIRLRAQTGPGVPDLPARRSAIDDLVARVTGEWPLFDFTAADGVQHAVWRVADALAPALVAGVCAVPALYIADGHHRAASAARARRHFGAAAGTRASGTRSWRWRFPTRRCRSCPTTASSGTSAATRRSRCWPRCASASTVDAGRPPSPARHGDVSMYLGGPLVHRRRSAAPRRRCCPTSGSTSAGCRRSSWRRCSGSATCAPTRASTSSAAAAAPTSSSAGSGRASGRSPSRCSRSASRELMAISDAGGVMPPKSTWFEPKLRDGLLSHLI